VLDIIILTIVVLTAFIAVSWYAHHKSQQRAEAFEKELDMTEEHDGENFQQRFDALFEQELHEHDEKVPMDASVESRFEDASDVFSQTNNSDDQQTTSEAHNEVENTLNTPTELAEEEPDPVDEEVSQNDWDMVIAFTIMAPESELFSGKAVKAALENQSLHFGDMQIYHRYYSDIKKQPLFSVANIIDPGTLLPDAFVSMKTPGLLLFSRFPGPVSGMALFDQLLECARSITFDLSGILCDETREPVTDDHIETLRARIFDYEKSLQAESSQDSNDYFN